MAWVLRKLAVMGVVAGLSLVVSLGSAGAFSPPQQQTPKKTGSPKGKTAKKGMPRPVMPAEGEAPAATTAGGEGGLKFSRDIAPILVANCGGCHNPQAPQFKRSGLSLATFDGLMKGGKAGQPVNPGNPDESLIVDRIKGENGPKMPPGNNRLSDNAIGKIAQWVKEGARLDAGIDASAPMAKYAATPEDLRKAELAKLTPADRDKKTEAVARDRLKKADPKSNPEMTASAHFLLLAEMPKERATAVLKTMEAQHARLGRLLAGNRGLNGPEKFGLYVFKDRKGFSEFVRTVENQEIDAGEDARSKLNVESPYVLAIDPLAGAPEPAGSASTKKAGRSRKGSEESIGGPERSLAGLLTEQFTAGTLAQSGKPPRWVTTGVGAWMSSTIEPRSPYYRKLRAEAFELTKQGWPTKASEALGDQTKPETVRAVGFAVVEWLYGTDPAAFTEFLHGMLEGGEKLDETIAACLNGNREQFLALTGAFVEQRYASGR